MTGCVPWERVVGVGRLLMGLSSTFLASSPPPEATRLDPVEEFALSGDLVEPLQSSICGPSSPIDASVIACLYEGTRSF